MPNVRAFDAHIIDDGSCNCCKARGGVTVLEFEGGTYTLVIRLCLPCLRETKGVVDHRLEALCG